MPEKFYTENVMKNIQREIEEEKVSLKRKYLSNEYFEKRMKEYREQSELVIFGAGNYGKNLFKILQQENIRSVKCFCDNGTIGKIREIEEVEILSPQDAIKRFPDAMYIITPKGYENEILRQLVSLGVDTRHISIFIMELTGLEEYA